jgi:hypothetical protein
MSDVDEREAKIQRVIAIVRHRNFERYGIDDVDEAFVRSMRDSMLDHVIERDAVLRDRGL